MTCRDCIHEDACFAMALECGYKCELLEGAEKCENFKNKADFVEVVHCEKCKYCDHCYPAKAIDKEPVEGWYCNLNSKYVLPTHFCSYGERREE